LDRIFGINAPNIHSIVSDEDWNILSNSIKGSEFWNHHWNWPVLFTEAFEQIGIHLENTRGDFESPEVIANNLTDERKLKYKIKNSVPYLILRSLYYQLRKDTLISRLSYEEDLFPITDKDILTGHRLKFRCRNSGIERIEDEIRKAFCFPEITDQRNQAVLEHIRGGNSVAIHARRGDSMSSNGYCYKNGYFKRAIKYIKKNVDNPEFFFFCDPSSIEWCKENQKNFGLDFTKDKVYFVDWNKGTESFRDMQLMASCKHNVVTESTFGWWGAWLNSNPNKITCSPNYSINTTHTF
jgi:hypothetical protein